MYIITIDDFVVHHPNMPNLQLPAAKLKLEVNTAGSLVFTIHPSHPNFDVIGKLKPIVKVLKDNAVIWKGRVVDTKADLDQVVDVYCEGKLKCLEDTIVRPFIFDDTANDVLTSFLSLHNTQVLDYQKILPGTLQLTDDIYRDLKNYESTYSRVQDLVSTVGGYLRFRYENDGDYLDWLTDFTTTATQDIILGENILNLTEEISAENTYTACIPLGAKLVDGDGNTLDTRLTVESSQGVDYLFNQSKVAEFGWVFAPITETTWDDVTTVSALLTRGSDFLTDTGIRLSDTIEITALDLAYTDSDIDSFNFCEYIHVISPIHNLNESYLLSAMDIDMVDPTKTKLTLGGMVLTLTDRAKQESDNVTITVNDLGKELQDNGNILNQEVTQRERYIRYLNGVIEMGESGSDLKMRLSNTQLAFLETMSGVETAVAYIENPTGNPGDSMFYIENGEIKQKLKIGGFEWQPRDNGNLSLVWKG